MVELLKRNKECIP